MFRHSCNAIAKRSLQQSRRCIARKQPPSSSSSSPSSLPSSWPHEQHPSVWRWSSTRTAGQGRGKNGSKGNNNNNNHHLCCTSSSRTTVTKTTTTTARASSSATTTSTTAGESASDLIGRVLLGRTLSSVSKESFRNAALPFIGNGAYMALASGFLMTDMLQLRLMLVGGYAGLVSFHALHAKPLQIPLRWSALFVVVNAGAALLLFVDQWIGALLTDEERALYETHFRDGLTTGQFYYLLRMSSTRSVDDGVVLTTEGRVSPYLYFIERGQAKVYHHGTFAAYVDEGGFVNDVAFQQPRGEQERVGSESTDSDDGLDGDVTSSDNDDNHNNSSSSSSGNEVGGAYGTVITNGECKVLVWDQEELREYLEQRPDMDRNMKYTLSQHLVRSLLKQREVRRQLSLSTAEQDDLEQIALTMPERKEFRRMRTMKTNLRWR
eukprot:jgi/Psemu1/209256/e_gw1.492.16.1